MVRLKWGIAKHANFVDITVEGKVRLLLDINWWMTWCNRGICI